MRPLSQASARYAILMVAGIYILLVGSLSALGRVGAIDSVTVAEAAQTITTLASLSVGAIIGFYLASQQRES